MSLKLFGKNAVVYAIGNVGLRAASFILIPLYTHSLSIEDYGLLMTLVLTMQFMLEAMNCGMRPCLVRFTKEYEKTNRLSVLLGTSSFINLLAGLVITGISLLLLVPVLRVVLHLADVSSYIYLICLISLLQSLSIHVMAYYRAQNAAIKFMMTGIVTAGILFVNSYIFLYVLHMGITGALWAKVATYAIVLVLVLLDVFMRTGIKISLTLIPALVRFGFPLIFSTSSQYVITGASVYFLSLFSGLEAVAIYSLGQKLAAVLAIVLILPFQQSFGPFVFANLDSPKVKKQISRLLTYLVTAIAGLSFCILFGARLLLPYIAPPEYAPAYIVILLLLPGMAFIGIYYFAETLIDIVQKTHLTGLTMTVCAILCVSLNYLLVRPLSWYGAIIATNVSFIFVGSALLIIGRKKYPIPIEWRRLGIAIGLFTAVIITNLALLKVNNASYYLISIIAVFAMGCALHFSSFYDMQEKLLFKNTAEKFKTILPGFLR